MPPRLQHPVHLVHRLLKIQMVQNAAPVDDVECAVIVGQRVRIHDLEFGLDLCLLRVIHAFRELDLRNIDASECLRMHSIVGDP